MNSDLQKRIQEALANPQNMGELANADAVGTVGNSDCGEMLRLWVKFRQQDGKQVIDRATFLKDLSHTVKSRLESESRGIIIAYKNYY